MQRNGAAPVLFLLLEISRTLKLTQKIARVESAPNEMHTYTRCISINPTMQNYIKQTLARVDLRLSYHAKIIPMLISSLKHWVQHASLLIIADPEIRNSPDDSFRPH